MVPRVKYLRVFEILAVQKKAVIEKTKQYSTSHIVHPGIKLPTKEDGARSIDPIEIPGIRKCDYDSCAMQSDCR